MQPACVVLHAGIISTEQKLEQCLSVLSSVQEEVRQHQQAVALTIQDDYTRRLQELTDAFEQQVYHNLLGDVGVVPVETCGALLTNTSSLCKAELCSNTRKLSHPVAHTALHMHSRMSSVLSTGVELAAGDTVPAGRLADRSSRCSAAGCTSAAARAAA